MKKRSFVFLIMLVSCLWICGAKISVYADSENVNTDGLIIHDWDAVADEFMSEDGVFSQHYLIHTCEIELVYDNGLVTIDCDSVSDMMKSYGVEAKIYCFEETQFTSSVYTPGSSYLYLDVIFHEKAKLGTDDKLWITLPDGLGLSHTEVRGRWAQPEEAVAEWIAVNDFVIPIDKEMTNHISIPLNQIVPGEKGNRLLLSFRSTPTGEAVTGAQKMRVIWRTDPAYYTVNYDAVIAPGFEKNDSLWKIILLAVVLILDVIVAVVVYLNLKQNPKKTDEPTAQTTELSEEETVAVKEKLQSNMKMNNDDMEYLKSIGYFDSKSSKGKDV